MMPLSSPCTIEIVMECDEDQVEEVKAWLEKAMVDGMGEVVQLNVGANIEC